MRRPSPSAVSLRVLGSGNAFGSGGRGHTSFLLDSPGSRVLIDFGASAPIAMTRFDIDSRSIDAVVLSHLHGDHFGGLPFLLMEMTFVSRRTRPLVIAGPRGTEQRVRETTDLLFPGFWPYPKPFTFTFLELAERQPLAVAGTTVTAFPAIHPSGAPAFSLRIACGGRTIAYSGDTAWSDALVDTARGSDLFICEATSYSRPIENHLTYRTVLANRDRFGARRILLTHVGPDVLARRKNLALEIANDGQLIVVKSRAVKRRPRGAPMTA